VTELNFESTGKITTDYAEDGRMGGSAPSILPIFQSMRETATLLAALFAMANAGNSNCNTYYPGDDVVDFVGCSLYSWSAYNIPHGYDGIISPKLAVRSQILS
jgi:hypothetical protein